jgi:hypothetical protein
MPEQDDKKIFEGHGIKLFFEAHDQFTISKIGRTEQDICFNNLLKPYP